MAHQSRLAQRRLEKEAPPQQAGAKWRLWSVGGGQGGFQAEKLPAQMHFFAELPLPQIRL